MRKYRISYIDGHDLKAKSFETIAENQDTALKNLWDAYPNGDFDHRIGSVTDEGEEACDPEKVMEVSCGGTKQKLLDLLQEISYGFDEAWETLESCGRFWSAWSTMQKFISEEIDDGEALETVHGKERLS